MRTSHRQIRKRILDAKSKISDEEFFSSRAYNGYLTDLAEAATKRYKRPLRVRVVADHDDDTVAFTDYHGIYINACNHITWSLPTRLLRSMSLEGFNAHECGHNLFTDNRIWNSYFSKLEKGKFYPKMPDGLDSMQKLHARDILEAVLDETDTVPYQVIMSVAHALQNILEDGYVDARYSYEFPGSPAKGIALNNLRFADTVPEISEMINRKYYDHSIVLNLLIQYIRAHEVNNLSGYTGEFIDKLYQYIPLVDECVYLYDHFLDSPATCNSLTAYMLREKIRFPSFWEIPYATVPSDISDAVHLAQEFAEFIYGAHLLYNIIYADGCGIHDDEVEAIRAEFKGYCDHYHSIHLEDVLAISKCPPMTSQFLRAFDTALQEGDIDAARDLLIRRERFVKQNRAKLNNPKSYRFERPIHYYKLDYRFGTASTIINDILTGLEA